MTWMMSLERAVVSYELNYFNLKCIGDLNPLACVHNKKYHHSQPFFIISPCFHFSDNRSLNMVIAISRWGNIEIIILVLKH